MILRDYLLVYEVTSMPQIIFAQATKANEPLYFEHKLEIPNELRAFPIECRISLYDPQGNLVEMAQRTEFHSTLTSILNTVPLKMIQTLLGKLSVQT